MKKHHLIERLCLSLVSLFLITMAHAGTQPKFEIIPTTSALVTVPVNGTATVQYRVTNRTKLTRTLTMEALPGITQTTTVPGSCSNPFTLAPNQSCVLTLTAHGSQIPTEGFLGGPKICKTMGAGNNNPDPFLCSQPSKANWLNVVPIAGAVISVSPTNLLFAENSTGEVTVTNSAASQVVAANIRATIPAGSSISVQSTTCGATLAIGASCTITFASGAQEGPVTILIAGDNTNTVNVEATVTSRPVISIDGPDQDQRVIEVGGDEPLELIIANEAGSLVSANDVTVSDKSNCPNITVNDSDCTSIAPGGTCTLELSSSSPYEPCTLTISGSNTANSPTTLVAFQHSGGLVFEESGGSGKVVTLLADEFDSQWTNGSTNIIGAGSSEDGVANTDAIVENVSCSAGDDECAARQCRDRYGNNWYLPASGELTAVANSLCPGGTSCIYGGFSPSSYWSSSQDSEDDANEVIFPSGFVNTLSKGTLLPIRCVQAF